MGLCHAQDQLNMLLIKQFLIRIEVNKMERQTVKIINIKQASLYIKNGLQPIKVYYDNHLVFEFDKEESNPLYTKWLNRTLK